MKTLARLYQQYAPSVYQFAIGLSGDAAWADDLTSETFVRALVSAKPIRQATVKAYLFTITRNLYLQQLRRERRLVPLSDRVLSERISPEETATQRNEIARVLAALQQLPHLDRTLLLLRTEAGLPHAQIAEMTDLTLANTKVRLLRARRKLKKLLEDEKL